MRNDVAHYIKERVVHSTIITPLRQAARPSFRKFFDYIMPSPYWYLNRNVVI